MPKAPIYNAREQEVLDSPDGYKVRVFQCGIGWAESILFDAQAALTSYNKIKSMNYRVGLYASRKINDEERLASITPAFLSALVDLNAGKCGC